MQLVAAERDDVGAGGHAVAHRRLLGEQLELGQGAAAEIVHQGALVRRGEPGELGERRLRGEADDAVVAGVDAQHRLGLLAPGALEVAQVGPVGGADLDEAGAALAQDVGDAEAVADLDELAAGDEHVAAARQRGEGEQHRGGVVVDDQRVLGAGQRAEDVVDVVLPRGALAALRG